MTKQYKNLMVMLHGYGSNGDDLSSLAPFFEALLPDTYFYSPDGIEPCELGVYGFQWFSLLDRSREAIFKEISSKSKIVDDMIKSKAQELEINRENTILLGFSQGTMLALYLSLIADNPYKGVIGYSGRLFIPTKTGNAKTPICLVHGKCDDVVPYDCLSEARVGLKNLGIEAKTLGIENLAHSIDMEGIRFATEFLKEL